MTISIRSLRPLAGRGNLRALADVEIRCDDGLTFTLHRCRVVQQQGQRAYLALPQFEDGQRQFFPAVSGPDLREAIQPVVLAEWQKIA